MRKLSATVITWNEEKNIGRCLESLSWTDEIIVVDAGSNDKTVEIAGEFTDKIYVNQWQDYSRQKNFAADKASHDWILSVDADERCTQELKLEILAVLRDPKFDGYSFPRKNFFMGKWLKHGGWYPDRVLRLFRKDAGCFEGALHEKVVISSGKTGFIKTPIIHEAYTGISQYIDKQNRYSSIAALSQKAPHPLIIVSKLFSKWIEVYILKRGFLDGFHGFFVSIMAAFFCFIKYLKRYYPGR